MNRKLRRNNGIDGSFVWKNVAAVLVVAIMGAVALAIATLWDYREAKDRSLEARINLLEKEAKRRTRPIIQVQNASIYSLEGELVLETHPGTGEKE